MTGRPDRARWRTCVRRALAWAGLCAALLAGAPARAAAQETRADTAAVLLRVAEQLEAEGRTALAAALLQTILERYGETPAAAEAARRRAPARTAAAEVTGSGRGELMVWGTLYGLWLGAAVPAAAGADDPEAYGLGLLLGGPTGFLAARLYAGEGLTEGQARAITFGGTWGTWQGFGWREVADVGRTPEATFTAMIAGGLTGLGIGAALAHNRPVTPGTATMVNFGALWGTWYGLAAAIAADMDGDDHRLTASLIGGNLGLIATALTAPAWNLSRQRARLINVAGVAGLVGGFGLLLLLQPEDDNTAILVPTLTSAAGLLAGAAWTRNYDRRSGPAGGGGGGGGGEALLERRGGRWTAGEPRPVPVLLEAGAGRRAPGVRLDLVAVRF